jgi:hypothetical protein
MRFVVTLATSALLFGQNVESELPARALTLLQSEGLVERVWGAYLCGSLLVEDCRAPLIAELGRAALFVDGPTVGAAFFYIQSLFDAMIRLDTVVPADLLLQFHPRWRDEVITLLTRSNAPEETLLSLESQQLTAAEWYAVSDQLLARRSRAFFVRTLTATRIEHFFEVFDDDGPRGYPGGHGDGILPAKQVRKVPVGFPPIGVYELRRDRATLGTLVSHGPCGTVHHRRIEIREAGTMVEPHWHPPAMRTSECRNAYLAAFVELPPAYAQAVFRANTKIRWTTPAEFLRQAQAALDANTKALRQIMRNAGIAPLVDLQTFRVTITPRFLDSRVNKHIRLPQIAPRQVGLQ